MNFASWVVAEFKRIFVEREHDFFLSQENSEKYGLDKVYFFATHAVIQLIIIHAVNFDFYIICDLIVRVI